MHTDIYNNIDRYKIELFKVQSIIGQISIDIAYENMMCKKYSEQNCHSTYNHKDKLNKLKEKMKIVEYREECLRKSNPEKYNEIMRNINKQLVEFNKKMEQIENQKYISKSEYNEILLKNEEAMKKYKMELEYEREFGNL